jgi:hypothetical protein
MDQGQLPQPPNPPGQGQPAEKTIPAESGAPVAAKPRKRSIFYRFLNFLFTPNSRFGRSMRAFTRSLAFGVGMFALGMLATYFALYRPAEQDLQATTTQLNKISAQYDATVKELNSLKAATLQEQAAKLNADVRINLQMMINHVMITRTAIVGRDFPNAKTALTSAQNDISTIMNLPSVNQPLRDDLKLIDARLTLVSSELSSDPVAAQSDLDLLIQKLTELDKSLSTQ